MRPSSNKGHGPHNTAWASALAGCRSAFFTTGVFSFVVNLLMLTGPLFMLQVYDRVLASRSVSTLVALTLLVAGLFTFMGLLQIVRARVLARIGQRLDDELGHRAFDGVIRLGLAAGAITQVQPLRDLDTVRQFLSGPGPITLFDLPWFPLYLAVIYLMHFDLGLLATVGVIVLGGLALLNEFVTRNPLSKASKCATAAHAFADEGRRNAHVIHALGMRTAMRTRWQRLHEEASTTQIQASDAAGSISSTAKALRLFMQSAILALGAYLAVMQEITAGTMIAASILMARALAPLDQAITHWRGFLSFRRASNRLRTLLAGMDATVTPMALPEPEAHVSVENLFVAAPDTRQPIISGLTFTLEPGSVLGIIGPTGAGKSTLARALVGVWPPMKGAVTLSGAPLSQWDSEQLGKYIGYLPQDVALFDGTVEDNIARFALEPDPEKVVAAAKLANAHELILQFSAGYKTKIGEGGTSLSAGQRQRVALARALYGSPKFVVLDEPNSNLDREGEAALIKAIVALKAQSAAVVIIAHRPRAIRVADELLYLKNGYQVAFGLRDEVLHKVTASSVQQPDPQHGAPSNESTPGSCDPPRKGAARAPKSVGRGKR